MNNLHKAAKAALEALENMLGAQSNPKRREFPTIYDFGKSRRAHDALRAALAAEPAPPVAWFLGEPGNYREVENWAAGAFPVYASPQQRQPLPLEDLEQLHFAHAKHQVESMGQSGWVEYARAVECAHRIGELS